MYIVRWDERDGQEHALVYDTRENARKKANALKGQSDVEWVYPVKKAGFRPKCGSIMERLRNLERKEDWLSWITLLEALILVALTWRTVMG